MYLLLQKPEFRPKGMIISLKERFEEEKKWF